VIAMFPLVRCSLAYHLKFDLSLFEAPALGKRESDGTGIDPLFLRSSGKESAAPIPAFIFRCNGSFKIICALELSRTYVLRHSQDKHNLITLQIINHYGIAGMVPADGHVSQYEIAKACNLPLEILVRLLRQAMTYDVFCEPKVGYVAHTEVSRVIPAMSPVLSYQLEICLPSTLKLLESLKESQDSQSKASRSPFQIAHSTPDTWWTYAEKSPTWTQEYGKYMALITSGGAHDVSHVVNGYDWAGLGPGTVIDVSFSPPSSRPRHKKKRKNERKPKRNTDGFSLTELKNLSTGRGRRWLCGNSIGKGQQSTLYNDPRLHEAGRTGEYENP